MIFPGSLFIIGICGFSYLIVALQVSSSFPPFYKKGDMQKEFKLLLPFIVAIMALLIGSALVPYLFLFIGVVSAWCGVRVRRVVKERTNGPLPWLLNPLTASTIDRWPMLLFDTWTIGLAALMGVTVYIG